MTQRKMDQSDFLPNVYCSKELTGDLHNHLICLSGINTLFASTAIVGNILISIALHRDNSLHQPSKVLIRNLVACDLCAGVIQLALVSHWMSTVHEQWQICPYFYFVEVIGTIITLSVSLWTTTSISVDRLLALLLGLRYRQVVTSRRVYVVSFASWVCPVVVGITLRFFRRDAWRIFGGATIIICLITSCYCYTRIFLRLSHRRNQVRDNHVEHKNQTTPILMNTTRYRKTVFSMIWIQSALAFCYLPYLFLAPFAYREIETTQSPAFFLTLYSTVTLMFFNSTLNPILYCCKIKEVRRAVKYVLSCS